MEGEFSLVATLIIALTETPLSYGFQTWAKCLLTARLLASRRRARRHLRGAAPPYCGAFGDARRIVAGDGGGRVRTRDVDSFTSGSGVRPLHKIGTPALRPSHLPEPSAFLGPNPWRPSELYAHQRFARLYVQVTSARSALDS